MRSERPPLVASWLLERFCADPGLTGDLMEEYGTRRSALWYWKQAIVASIPPVYAIAVSTIDGSKDGSALAWEVTARVATLLVLMSGGVLSTYRDQIKQTRESAQDWRPGSPRPVAAR